MINNPDSTEWPSTIYNNFGGVFQLYFDSKLRKVFSRQYSGKFEEKDSNFYKVPVEASISLDKSEFKELPVHFPQIYISNYFGDANLVFREVNDSSNIYTFMASPDIYVYNRFTGKGYSIKAESTFQENSVPALDRKAFLDMNRKLDHLIASPLYLKTHYDKLNHRYYRIMLKSVDLKNRDDTYNTFSDKDLIVSVLNESFQIIKEFNLGTGYLWNYSFVSPRGLYLLKNVKISVNQSFVNGKTFVFDIFRFTPE